jgi:hypothetical protein
LSGPTAIIAFAVAERQASLACAMRPAELEAGRYHMACRKPVEKCAGELFKNSYLGQE